MNCDPNSLIQAATCYRCIPKGMQGQVAIYLLCQWANAAESACGNQGPAWMGTPTLSFAGEFLAISYPLEIPPPPPFDAGYFILFWGNAPGGPYPNSLTVPLANAANPFALLPPPLSSNFTTGVFTYFVVRSFDTMDHCSDLSAEVSHIFTAPGSVTPVWTPTTEQVTWTDVNGTFVGDLATFEHDVAVGSLTNLTFGATGNLTSLSGLQTAPNLAVLDVNTNALTSLDCHGLASLTTLNCSDNASLTTLTLTGCTALVTLDCSACAITPTITGILTCTSIVTVYCNLNQMTSLDVHNLTTLDYLQCNGNPLLTLDVSGCTALTNLQAGASSLTTLDVHTCTAMVFMDCAGNASMTTLNVTGLSSMTTLALDTSGVLNLDLSTCTALVNLDCSNNGMTALNINGCAALGIAYVNNNNLTSLDFTTSTSIVTIHAGANSLTGAGLNVTGCTLLNTLLANDNLLLTSIDVSTCTAIANLQCSGSGLTSANVAGCGNLTAIDLSFNSMNSTNVSTVLCDVDVNGPINGTLAIQSNAVPTAGGLVCSANLDPGKGWTVTHD